MWIASSAYPTCSAVLSASEYTATVLMPSSLQARMTRMAISPRLATRILLIISLEKCQQNSFLVGVQPGAPLMICGPRLCPGNRIANRFFERAEFKPRLARFGNIHAREACALFIVRNPNGHVAPWLNLVLLQELCARPMDRGDTAGGALAGIQHFPKKQLRRGSCRVVNARCAVLD